MGRALDWGDWFWLRCCLLLCDLGQVTEARSPELGGAFKGTLFSSHPILSLEIPLLHLMRKTMKGHPLLPEGLLCTLRLVLHSSIVTVP